MSIPDTSLPGTALYRQSCSRAQRAAWQRERQWPASEVRSAGIQVLGPKELWADAVWEPYPTHPCQHTACRCLFLFLSQFCGYRVRSHTGLLAFWDIFFEKNPFKSVDHVLTWVVWICLLLLTDLEAFLMYLGVVLCWIFVNILPQSVLAFSPSLVRSYSSWLVSSMSCLGNLCPHQTHEASILTHLWQLCGLIFRPVVYIPWIVTVYSVTGGWLFVSYLYSVINHNLLKKNFPLQGSGAFVISQGTLYTWSVYESSCF